MRQQRNLHFWGTGIALFPSVRFYDLLLLLNGQNHTFLYVIPCTVKRFVRHFKNNLNVFSTLRVSVMSLKFAVICTVSFFTSRKCLDAASGYPFLYNNLAQIQNFSHVWTCENPVGTHSWPMQRRRWAVRYTFGAQWTTEGAKLGDAHRFAFRSECIADTGCRLQYAVRSVTDVDRISAHSRKAANSITEAVAS